MNAMARSLVEAIALRLRERSALADGVECGVGDDEARENWVLRLPALLVPAHASLTTRIPLMGPIHMDMVGRWASSLYSQHSIPLAQK
jgi:hypothetical protein